MGLAHLKQNLTKQIKDLLDAAQMMAEVFKEHDFLITCIASPSDTSCKTLAYIQPHNLANVQEKWPQSYKILQES